MRPTEPKLRDLYLQKTDAEIGAMFGVSGRSVCDWRKQYGISTNPDHRPSHNIDEKTLRELNVLHTDAEIGVILGVSGRSIHNWRARLGIQQRHAGRRRPSAYSLDVDFFENIDSEEKAYILGLLSADGYVDRTGKWVAIALQERDEHILVDLKRAINSSAPIRCKTSVGGFAGSKPQKVLTLSSRKLVVDLARFGVVPRKSYTITYPVIDPNLDRHFIRGIVDGDGHIGDRQFIVLGTDRLLEDVRKRVLFHTGKLLSESRLRGFQRLVGSRRDAAVLKWLYEGATIFIRRKHQRFAEHWS